MEALQARTLALARWPGGLARSHRGVGHRPNNGCLLGRLSSPSTAMWRWPDSPGAALSPSLVEGSPFEPQGQQATEGTCMLNAEVRDAVRIRFGPWWTFLIAGLVWFLISLIVLQMNLRSVTAVGVLLGVVFLISGLEEFFVAAVIDSWAWARALLGIFFVIAAIWSFIDPIGTFVAIADALGFLLIFKGTLDLVTSIASQGVNSVWWLGLLAGLLELFLGFWAAQQYFPARASLLLLWVGFYALFRGISSIVYAFHLRSAT